MWLVFLVAIPAAIVFVHPKLGIPTFDAGVWSRIAVWAFWVIGCGGLYCGLLFVVYGKGTPLPVDETTSLVVMGPYRYVRNPMALFGIAQGMLVGLSVGSWPVVAYALCGSLAWHRFARPYEERDLERRFGETYTKYKAEVRNWLPRLRPYPKIK